MRTVQQIIEDAQAELKRQRANAEEAKMSAERTRREDNAKLWAPIVEALKPHIPVELHECVSFDASQGPDWHRQGEYYTHQRRPISITLPVPEKYTVFGYAIEGTVGFTAGILRYNDDGEPYYTTLGDYWTRSQYEVANLHSFQIALAETIELYSPRKERPFPPPQEAARPITSGEMLEDLIRDIVRAELNRFQNDVE